MRNQLSIFALISFVALQGCASKKIDDLPEPKREKRETIVETSVQPPLSVTIYALRPRSAKSTRVAICHNVSHFEKCKLSWNIADPTSGVVLQIKALAYPDCPILRPEMVTAFCYNTDDIIFSKDDIIVLNVLYRLNFSNYSLKPKPFDEF